jgi:hypothetical protein
MAPEVPAYTIHYSIEQQDPARFEYRSRQLTRIVHAIACSQCFERLCGGSEEPEDMNRALDAQMDLLVATFDGDVRIALLRTAQSLGFAVDKLSRLDPGGF